MILSAQEIRRRCRDHYMLEPFSERSTQNGLTYGLSPAGYDIRVAQDLRLWPGKFALASSIEHFNMPLDVLGIVHDKSTWARRGLCVQNTVIEPGWEGFLTLELTNHANGGQGFMKGPDGIMHDASMIMLRKGDPIAQIVFHRLVEPTSQPYRGKYQNQGELPVPAIMESNE